MKNFKAHRPAKTSIIVERILYNTFLSNIHFLWDGLMMVGLKTILGGFVWLTMFSLAAHAQENRSTISLDELSPQPTSSRKFTGDYAFEFEGDSFAQGKDEGAAAGFSFRTRLDFRLSRMFKAYVEPRVDLYSSRLQERFDDDTYKNRLRLMDGYIQFKPLPWGEVRVGSHSQEYLNSPMMISGNRAFPGGQARLGFEFGNHKLELIAQDVVPTSYSMNYEREDKEKLPWFATQSIHFSGKNFEFVDWKVFGGHFTWSSLPNIVAFDSAKAGNSVTGEEAPGSTFVYGFDGYFGGAEVCACWVTSPVQLVAEFQRIDNQAAAAGFGDAQMWGIGPRFIFGDQTLDIRYRRYFIEKDATVAVYNRSGIGNTNRIGDDVEFRLDFRDAKFAILGEWVNAVPLRSSLNNTQMTITSVTVGVETHYAPF